MSKSSVLNDKIIDKSTVALICILGMFAGFLVSRAMLSIAMFLFGVNAIRDVPVKQWLRQKWWLLGLAWVAMYALSYFWSADKGRWEDHLQTKLPFLLLPLAFSYQPRFSPRQIQVFTITMAIMLIGAACYSVSFFITDPAFYIDEYKVSHMLPTLPKKDHIRSSIASALCIIWCVYAWPQITGKGRGIVAVCILLLITYIHILAAKSGLLSFYLFVVAWGFFLAFGKRKIIGFAVLLLFPLALFLAVKFIPTLKERANYIEFTIFMYRHNEETARLGDIGRLVSYKLGAEIIGDHKLYGVGTGDMKARMDSLYVRQYPEIAPASRLLPHNQFMVVAIACGIPAMMLFLIWVLWPLTRMKKNRQSFFFFIVWFILLVQLLIEPVLEVQFGVFVYLFFLLLFLQEIGDRKKPQDNDVIAGTGGLYV